MASRIQTGDLPHKASLILQIFHLGIAFKAIAAMAQIKKLGHIRKRRGAVCKIDEECIVGLAVSLGDDAHVHILSFLDGPVEEETAAMALKASIKDQSDLLQILCRKTVEPEVVGLLVAGFRKQSGNEWLQLARLCRHVHTFKQRNKFTGGQSVPIVGQIDHKAAPPGRAACKGLCQVLPGVRILRHGSQERKEASFTSGFRTQDPVQNADSLPMVLMLESYVEGHGLDFDIAKRSLGKNERKPVTSCALASRRPIDHQFFQCLQIERFQNQVGLKFANGLGAVVVAESASKHFALLD